MEGGEGGEEVRRIRGGTLGGNGSGDLGSFRGYRGDVRRGSLGDLIIGENSRIPILHYHHLFMRARRYSYTKSVKSAQN